MKRSRRLALLSCAFAILLFVAANARATEGGANPAEAGIGELFKWINFAIVASAIGYLLVKKAPSFFAKRADAITSAIQQATAAKAAADQQLHDAEARLARLDQEVAGLRSAAEQEAAAEGERLRALTRSDETKIAAAGRAEIEAAERAARLELKVLAAQLAVDGAESLLAKQITAKTQDSLFGVFVESLAGRSN
jgi:F-type H+-transporting ATPase subunit b